MRGFCLFLAGVIVLGTASAFARTWTDTSGKQTQGKFVRYHQGDVVILRGAKVVTIPFNTLSDEDQEYVRKQLEAKGQGDLLPSPSSRAGPLGASSTDGRLAAPGPERTWTSNDGKKIQAQLVGVSGDKVTLLFQGKEVTVPLSRLSEADQQYVKEEQTKQQKNAAPPRANPQPLPANPGPHPAWSPPAWSPPVQTPHFNPPPFTPTPTPQPSPNFGDPMIPMPHPQPHMPQPHMPQPYIPQPYIPQPDPFGFSPMQGRDFSQPGIPAGGVKVCTKCGRPIPGNLGAGDKCPHCGAFFAYETDASGRVVKTVPIGKYLVIGGLVPLGAIVIGLVIWFLKSN